MPAIVHPGADGTEFTVNADRKDMEANDLYGLLMVHHHNATGNRTQEVELVVPYAPTP